MLCRDYTRACSGSHPQHLALLLKRMLFGDGLGCVNGIVWGRRERLLSKAEDNLFLGSLAGRTHCPRHPVKS